MGSSLKRFTDTGKWSDPWFRSLSPSAKLLWSWLVDSCDNAGVIDPDSALASFQIGDKIEDKHFSELGSRIKTLPNGKLWIHKFIKFQFGELSQTSKVHASVIRLIQSHGLDYSIPLLSDRNENLIGGLTTKEKDKDKRKDKVKEIEAWLVELSASEAYKHINVKVEFEKARQWILSHNGRMFTRRFFVGWLNRIERPIGVLASAHPSHWPDHKELVEYAKQKGDNKAYHYQWYEFWKKKDFRRNGVPLDWKTEFSNQFAAHRAKEA